MKKFIAILTVLALVAAMPFVLATSETFIEITPEAVEVDQSLTLEGTVMEIVDGGFVLMDKHQGEVMINTSKSTVWDGQFDKLELQVGQYVYVDFDGAMTRSIPPQAHADRVSLYLFVGMVTEKLEDGSVLVFNEMEGEVIVHLGEGMDHVHVGSPITVFHNGVMAMSLPAQITAGDVRLYVENGEVTEVSEASFTIVTDDIGREFVVHVSDETLYTLETEEPAEGATMVSLNVGDKVSVYYNGVMARSIPAQIYALEVVVNP